MKKLILIAISFLITGIAFGHGNGWSNRNERGTENNRQYWQQNKIWHEVMHDTKIEATNTNSGVNLQISISSDEAQKALVDDFQLSQEKLAAYFESVDVLLEVQENEWVINFSSSDDQLVKRLQNSGNGLWYEFLHLKMQETMHSNYGNHHMGMGGGYNRHMGYGPGRMHGGFQGCSGFGLGSNRNSDRR